MNNRKITDVVAALIWEGDQFLICQRPAHKARGLLWEFVGGKLEAGEYPDLLVRLTLFHAAIVSGTPQMLEHNDIRWITVDQIPAFAFCPADVDILKKLQREGKPHDRI